MRVITVPLMTKAKTDKTTIKAKAKPKPKPRAKTTGNDRTIAQDAKTAVSRTAIAVMVVAAICFVGFPILIIGSLSLSCTFSNHRLNREAGTQKKGLDSLTILNGQHINSESSISGDCLTGSTSASANIPTSLNASQAAAAVKQNLERQGFKEEYPLDLPPQPTSYRRDNGLDSLSETYLKNDESAELRISYDFAKKFLCSDPQLPCEQQVGFFLQTPLKSVDIHYEQYIK